MCCDGGLQRWQKGAINTGSRRPSNYNCVFVSQFEAFSAAAFDGFRDEL